MSVFKVAPRVLVDNEASRTTVIEVNGRDRQGLLYDLTRALSALNLQSVRRISRRSERPRSTCLSRMFSDCRLHAESKLKRFMLIFSMS